ncbi:MAG TPA: ABC transporter ATP-binding protein, partial [Tepidiformaceae bacterium]|nr:ABC transporter ATP-binding protein [Tepidiformaceae bacterium]
MSLGTVVGAAVAVRNVRVSYPARGGALLALDGVSFDVAPGEFVSVLGPSGCGKSTLLRVVAGIRPPTTGEIAIDDRKPGHLRDEHGLGLVFQDPSLLPWRTVLGNVRLPEMASGPRRGAAEAAVEQVGLSEFRDYYPHQLSGGMRQRTALARALAGAPRLLLMDEPFGALDELTREEMRAELLRIWERERITVLFVTHSITEAVLLSDRVLVMTGRPGRIRAEVPIHLDRPRTLEMDADPRFREYVSRLRAHLR